MEWRRCHKGSTVVLVHSGELHLEHVHVKRPLQGLLKARISCLATCLVLDLKALLADVVDYMVSASNAQAVQAPCRALPIILASGVWHSKLTNHCHAVGPTVIIIVRNSAGGRQ
jgi:hypothetical protein